MPKITLGVEKDAQDIFVQHVRAKGWGHLLMMIPNGTQLPGDARKRAMYMNSLKKQGLLPGAFDLFFAHAVGKYHGAFFEMKRTKGGVISPEQIVFHGNMLKQGYYADICAGEDKAIASWEEYMLGGKPLWFK
jgi:hypothetical protein